jgi:preprotein translocase subunit SecE
MNMTKTVEKTHRWNMIKWLGVTILFILGIVANYYFIQQSFYLKVVGWFVLLAVMSSIIFQTVLGQKLWNFFKAAYLELKKVVWPTRQETFRTTGFVIFIIAIFSIVLWVLDFSLVSLMNWFTGQF